MKLWMVILFIGGSLSAEPVVEMFPAESELCDNYGASAQCPQDTYLQFSDDQRCACLMDGQFTHPKKCMIGPMKCDVKRGQSYSWLHHYETMNGNLVEKASGCACVVTKPSA